MKMKDVSEILSMREEVLNDPMLYVIIPVLSFKVKCVNNQKAINRFVEV